MKLENMKMFWIFLKFFGKKNNNFGFEKKSFGSGADTEIVPRFRFLISKPGFGRTLLLSSREFYWE